MRKPMLLAHQPLLRSRARHHAVQATFIAVQGPVAAAR
ncbi:MAG: hypothetical protein H6Q77_2028 [Gemmatimonadetes bacterium]|jgi:hypothetical protein|nr:hypothetical protein [Gemmatimonadota bacterium]